VESPPWPIERTHAASIDADENLRHNQNRALFWSNQKRCNNRAEQRKERQSRDSGGRVNRLLAFGVGVTLAAGAVVVGYSIQRRSNTAQEFQRQVELAKM